MIASPQLDTVSNRRNRT